jgi:hypothetical protein
MAYHGNKLPIALAETILQTVLNRYVADTFAVNKIVTHVTIECSKIIPWSFENNSVSSFKAPRRLALGGVLVILLYRDG